jgi:hypothetical protein
VSALRVCLPWAVGLGLVAALLLRVDARSTWTALSHSDLQSFAPLAAAFLLAALCVDAWVLARLFSAALGRQLAWSRMLCWRAASYAFLALSFHLASAALLARIRSRTDASWPELTGALLVHYLGDLVALAAIALAGSWAVELPALVLLRPVLAALLLGLCGLALLARARRGALAGRPVVAVAARLSLADLARLVAGRLLWYATAVAFVAATLPSFGVQIPLAALVGRMPIVLALAALPISPAGLGTTQAAMLALFGEFAPEPELLAYSLSYTGLLLARAPLGGAVWLAESRAASAGALLP